MIDLHLRELARLTGELELYLVEVIGVDMSVTSRADELTWLESAYLSNHHGQQSIRSDVERHPKEHIGATLIELT